MSWFGRGKRKLPFKVLKAGHLFRCIHDHKLITDWDFEFLPVIDAQELWDLLAEHYPIEPASLPDHCTRCREDLAESVNECFENADDEVAPERETVNV